MNLFFQLQPKLIYGIKKKNFDPSPFIEVSTHQTKAVFMLFSVSFSVKFKKVGPNKNLSKRDKCVEKKLMSQGFISIHLSFLILFHLQAWMINKANTITVISRLLCTSYNRSRYHCSQFRYYRRQIHVDYILFATFRHTRCSGRMLNAPPYWVWNAEGKASWT